MRQFYQLSRREQWLQRDVLYREFPSLQSWIVKQRVAVDERSGMRANYINPCSDQKLFVEDECVNAFFLLLHRDERVHERNWHEIPSEIFSMFLHLRVSISKPENATHSELMRCAYEISECLQRCMSLCFVGSKTQRMYSHVYGGIYFDANVNVFEFKFVWPWIHVNHNDAVRFRILAVNELITKFGDPERDSWETRVLTPSIFTSPVCIPTQSPCRECVCQSSHALSRKRKRRVDCPTCKGSGFLTADLVFAHLFTAGRTAEDAALGDTDRLQTFEGLSIVEGCVRQTCTRSAEFRIPVHMQTPTAPRLDVQTAARKTSWRKFFSGAQDPLFFSELKHVRVESDEMAQNVERVIRFMDVNWRMLCVRVVVAIRSIDGWLVGVSGQGNNWCLIKNGFHAKSQIYFQITNTNIVQKCFNCKSCAKRASSAFLVPLDILRKKKQTASDEKKSLDLVRRRDSLQSFLISKFSAHVQTPVAREVQWLADTIFGYQLAIRNKTPSS